MDFRKRIDDYRNEIIQAIQDFVKIKSVQEASEEGKPFGKGPYDALMYALNIGRKLGFKAENFDGYAGHVEYGEGNKIIGILVHVDVVPEGDGWTFPPFGGEIHNAKIYGRGSYDDKGACIAALYALKAIKDSGLTLDKKVRIIFGANEETGMTDIPYYLSKNREPDMAFSPDSPFPVVYGEKGILDLILSKKINNNYGKFSVKSILGGDMPKKVPDFCNVIMNLPKEDKHDLKSIATRYIEKKRAKVELIEKGNKIFIKYTGKSASAISPENSDNAISGMMEFLECLCLPDSDFKDFIQFYNERIGYTIYGERMGCAFQDDISTPLSFCPTIINYDGETVKMHVHIRYPIKTKFEELMAKIKNTLFAYSIEIKVERHSKPHYVSKHSFLTSTLMNIYREETGDYNSKEITMAGGTYARILKNAVAFGPLFPNEKQVAHEVDEYLCIDSIIKATKIYARAIYELAK
ncbi:MAG: dipeptidase PepV [Candidatus Lokiarchaeota archaeon]|nr:dipeptidase PepV [Candidatus Lokiarchaeota archaeon]